MRLSRPIVVALSCAGLFFLLTVPIVLGHNWPGEWKLVVWITSLRRPALTTAMQLLTFLAAARAALLVSVGVGAITIWRQRRLSRQGLFPLVALLGSVPFNFILRTAVGRLRPGVNYIPNLLPEIRHPFQRWSYPSGHAITSVVTWGALAYLLWTSWKNSSAAGPIRLFWVFLIAVITLVGGIGFSRVYLGVHWPTDVIGGWLVGLSWLATSIAWAFREGDIDHSSIR